MGHHPQMFLLIFFIQHAHSQLHFGDPKDIGLFPVFLIASCCPPLVRPAQPSKASAHDFIQTFPLGYHTKAGEGQ